MEMFINEENLVKEARDQIDRIVKDDAFIDSCLSAVAGTGGRRNVIRKMLDCKIKSIIHEIVQRHLAMLIEAESRLSDSIH